MQCVINGVWRRVGTNDNGNVVRLQHDCSVSTRLPSPAVWLLARPALTFTISVSQLGTKPPHTDTVTAGAGRGGHRPSGNCSLFSVPLTEVYDGRRELLHFPRHFRLLEQECALNTAKNISLTPKIFGQSWEKYLINPKNLHNHNV